MRWDRFSGNHRKESKPGEPEPCRQCHGEGYEVDYVGLEMKRVQVDCSCCHGSGLHNKLND